MLNKRLNLQMQELSVIQKTYDLIKWYVPILNRLPKNHKYTLGTRTTEMLYQILEDLIRTKFAKQKQEKLEEINISLTCLRYQTRLLYDFSLFQFSVTNLSAIRSMILAKKLADGTKAYSKKDETPWQFIPRSYCI